MIFKYQEEGQWFVGHSSRPDRYKGWEPVTVDDPLVTVLRLIELWESLLEGENFHSMMHIPETLVMTLRRAHLTEEQLKLVLWDIVNNGGLI